MRARWQLALAGGALVAAGALLPVREARERLWLESMVANGCWPLIPVTDVVVLAWSSFGLALIGAVLLLRVGLRCIRAARAGLGTVLLVGACAALVAALVLGLAAFGTPTTPLQGVDGSGLPCPGG